MCSPCRNYSGTTPTLGEDDEVSLPVNLTYRLITPFTVVAPQILVFDPEGIEEYGRREAKIEAATIQRRFTLRRIPLEVHGLTYVSDVYFTS